MSVSILSRHIANSNARNLVKGTIEAILPDDVGDRTTSYLADTCIIADVFVGEKISNVLVDLHHN